MTNIGTIKKWNSLLKIIIKIATYVSKMNISSQNLINVKEITELVKMIGKDHMDKLNTIRKDIMKLVRN